MTRWILAMGLALASGVACSTSSSNGNPGGGDASGCPCMVPLEAGAMSIPCKLITCVEGTDYLCPQSGIPIPQGACILNDASMTDACVPHCLTGSCASDGCGGVCHCQTGSICVGGMCGNGCSGIAGDYCNPAGPDAGGPTTCCGVGYQCAADDAGADKCCSITSQAPCTSDNDCCDFPAVGCHVISTDGGMSRVCN